ncbi:coproporphyrinogen dehydrogenase HemZ [Haloplasma contractile]|uniref:Oxygen-independent coproporphyrinogen III oxidase protein n=1 Tax=Haloplasma contractile SSD-17B TaxID=1033810 RepID=U2FIP1_9MOLU|nr:coproporphyrinogen dehydrogenase HemZ [Haloplasma contractile]ERJ11109.1 oxygen-independent coproporphyrinogen III oxidase protein [Haloplasma contractile SSD-17B]
MRIKINGIEDEKTLFSLKKVTNTFFPEFEFVDKKKDLEVTFTISFKENTIMVLSETDQYKIIEKRTAKYKMDKRYAILGAYYRLLSKVTGKTLPYGVLNGIRPTKLVHRFLKQGIDLLHVNQILQETYFVSKEKADLLCEVATNQHRTIPDLYQLGHEISVYINIPFCPSRCSYCSFTAFKLSNKQVHVMDYIQALTKEIKALGKLLLEQNLNVTTIYIGGGTPTSLSASNLEVVLKEIQQHIPLSSLREYTVEAGRPDSITQDHLDLLKKYRVDRISINPQTFNDETLKVIGRHHNKENILSTYRMARDTGHNNINMDVIIGLPNEDANTVTNTMLQTLKLDPESITVHTLALKRSSKLSKRYDLSGVGHMTEIESMHDVVRSKLKHTAYKPYYLYRQKNILGNLENIGYAKDGYFSLYNIIIMEELQNIIGLGCGSSSKFLLGKTILSPKDLKTYVETSDEYFKKKQMALLDSIHTLRGNK